MAKMAKMAKYVYFCAAASRWGSGRRRPSLEVEMAKMAKMAKIVYFSSGNSLADGLHERKALRLKGKVGVLTGAGRDGGGGIAREARP